MNKMFYHNFGEQKTEAWQSFQGGNDISFPIQFCIDKCRLAYLLSLGKDKAKIGIDFYDANGNVYNNPGCDSLEFEFDINLCNLVDVSAELIENIGTCCTYEISVNMSVLEGCEDFNPGTEILEDLMSSSIKFRGYNDTNYLSISSLQPYNYNPGTKTHTFRYQVCDPSDTLASNFIISFEADSISCETEPIEFPACLCDCPVDIDSWVTLSSVAGDEQCGYNMCRVTMDIEIPNSSIYDCFTHYSIGNQPKVPFSFHSTFSDCLQKGEYKTYDFTFYKSISDTTPCSFQKSINCPMEDFVQSCVPDCDSVKFEDQEEIDYPLPGCSGCNLIINYSSRINPCNGKQEIQVKSLSTYNSGSDSLSCANCTLTIEEIYKLAVLKIIYDNKMNFEPNSVFYGCNDTWRVVNSACWSEYENPLHSGFGDSIPIGFNPENMEPILMPTKTWVPCDSTLCCSIGLRVCRFQSEPTDFITVDTLGNVNGTDSCALYQNLVFNNTKLTFPQIDTVQCEDRCHWLHSLTSEGFFGKQIFSTPIITENYKNSFSLNSEITQFDEFLEVKLNTDIEAENIRFVVYSIHGKILKNYNYGLSKGFNLFHIHTNELNTGLYFCNIEINGVSFETFKFLVVR